MAKKGGGERERGGGLEKTIAKEIMGGFKLIGEAAGLSDGDEEVQAGVFEMLLEGVWPMNNWECGWKAGSTDIM